MSAYRSIEWRDGAVRMLDQRRLPHETIYLDYTDYRQVQPFGRWSSGVHRPSVRPRPTGWL
jgi:hypothetical protein